MAKKPKLASTKAFISKRTANMTLGEKIKYVRQKRKMSQAELAKAINIYQKNISRYELNTTVPSAIVLKNIADVLEVSTDFLLSEDNRELTIDDRDLKAKFAELQHMTGKNRELANTFLDLLIRDHRTKQAYQD